MFGRGLRSPDAMEWRVPVMRNGFGNVDPLKKVWMLNFIDLLIISCVSWVGCNHFSRLPLALKLLPWKSMLEQEVMMIFTRFRCRMFLKAPHSSMKLLDAPRRCRLRTLIATSVPSSSMFPLYTVLKLPSPIKLVVENPSVALKSLS